MADENACADAAVGMIERAMEVTMTNERRLTHADFAKRTTRLIETIANWSAGSFDLPVNEPMRREDVARFCHHIRERLQWIEEAADPQRATEGGR